MTHAVFISYSSKDEAHANAVCAGLEQEGLSCWIAPRDVRPGMEYGAEIVRAIRSARVLLLLFTAQSNSSPHVLKEVERAVKYGVPVVPLRIENVEPSDSFEYFLCTPHWLNVLDEPVESAIPHVVQVLRSFTSEEPHDEKSPAPESVVPPPPFVVPGNDPLDVKLPIPTTPTELAEDLGHAIEDLEASTSSVGEADKSMRAQADRVYRILQDATDGDRRLTYRQLTTRLLGRPEPSDSEIASVKQHVATLMRSGYLPGVGARPTELYVVEEYFSFKTVQRGDEKLRVATRCLDFIDNGLLLVLDAGSTTLKIAELLAEEIRQGTITDAAIVCFSPPHLEHILRAANDRGMVDEDCHIQIYSPGGRVRLTTQAIVFQDDYEEGNRQALLAYAAHLDRHTVCFVGANGITAKDGFTTKTQIETRNKQTILSLADEQVIVADAGKIGKVWASCFAEMSPDITLVVDDISANERMFGTAIEGIRSTGCKVVLA